MKGPVQKKPRTNKEDEEGGEEEDKDPVYHKYTMSQLEKMDWTTLIKQFTKLERGQSVKSEIVWWKKHGGKAAYAKWVFHSGEEQES